MKMSDGRLRKGPSVLGQAFRETGTTERDTPLHNSKREKIRMPEAANWVFQRLARPALVVLSLMFALLWLGGIVSYVVLPEPPIEAKWAAPAFLATACAIAVVSTQRGQLGVLVVAGLIGFASEVVGVYAGLPFGAYDYTGTLGPRFLDVPIVMSAAWLVLVAYAVYLTSMLRTKGWTNALLAAAWLTAIDLVIDPLASGSLDYWRWRGEGYYYGVPLVNFLGWFMVSFLIFTLLRKTREPNRVHRLLGASVVLFFTLIALAESLLIPASVGVLLLISQVGLEAFPAAAVPREFGELEQPKDHKLTEGEE
jgi:putative membrane protein